MSGIDVPSIPVETLCDVGAEIVLDHLDDLDPQVAERMMDKVDEAAEWTEHRLEKLSGWSFYKLRAGDYRAIISWTAGKISWSSRP